MNAAPRGPSAAMRRRAWRWHFLAAIVVVPFVLWQSLTGTAYLWSEAWVDAMHPELRVVEDEGPAIALDLQVAAARDAVPGRIADILVPGEPGRATRVTFADGGLASAAFVDPRDGRLLGVLSPAQWTPGWTRRLHGGWPLGNPGSWLLELGASLAIVMVLTGLYLWWPRDGRRWHAALWPRLHGGPRLFWRELHACIAAWFSILIVLFLLTALPWTHFWGSVLFKPLQQAIGQQMPAAAGFAPVFVPETGARPARTASLQQLLEQARADGLDGDLVFRLVDGPPGSAVSVRNLKARASQARYVLLDRASARTVGGADWGDFPLVAKGVATGVDIHEGRFFGRLSPWLNTLLAAALSGLCVTGLMAWWRRRPPGGVGAPPAVHSPWPTGLRWAAGVAFVFLPMLAITAALLYLGEHAWHALGKEARR